MDVQAGESHSLREIMGAYPTGVTVVAACDAEGTPYGLTVNSFTSVSLDPPLVLVCIGHSSTSHDRLVGAECFAISVLAADQRHTARRFAAEPSDGRFGEVPWSLGANGSPLLDGAVAWLECTMYEVVVGGDHSIVIGRVDRSALSDRPALVFLRGRMSGFDP
jgi:flavin reductase (DIM6/NTAB) family NADH-FMN oxidoreductase RutF